METGQLRPEWRGFMLMILRGGVGPLCRGVLSYPKCSFDDIDLRERVAKLGPSWQRLLQQGSGCPLAIMEAFFDSQGPGAIPLEATRNMLEYVITARSSLKRVGFTRKEAQHFTGQASIFIEGLRLHPMWIEIEKLRQDDFVMQWIQWFFCVNAVSIWRWMIPFPFLLFLARDGSDPIAKAAFFRVIGIDKTAITLPWARQRIEEAAIKNDKEFLRKLGQALVAPSIPKQLKATALDFFLCLFNSWLEELSLLEQAALIREADLCVSAKTLRNRRSKLGLPTIDHSLKIDIPKELGGLISETQEKLRKGPDGC